MTEITKEAIEALRLKAFETNTPSDRHAYYTTLSKAFQNGELVVLSTLPVAGEGKTPNRWRLVPVKPTEEMIMAAFDAHEPLDGNDDDFRAEFSRTYRAMTAAAPTPPSSPGKDGGQEVEAVKPSIDTMREAAWELIKKAGWGATARLSLHQVSGLMAQFGMNVSRGEVGCGYPDCGCCADAACEDAIKQHADFSSPQSTVDADAVIERCAKLLDDEADRMEDNWNAYIRLENKGPASTYYTAVRGYADKIRALKAKSPSSDLAASEGIEADPTDEFLAQVSKELKRARAKFPGDRIMTIALAEEFGELAKAMLDEDGEAVWKEAVQTAVMAARVAIDGDSSVDEWRAAKGLGNHRLAGLAEAKGSGQ